MYKKITIYITNVTYWLEELKLWNLLDDEIKTIYLPDKRISMFPNEFIHLCSLKQYSIRIALCINVFIRSNKVIEVNYQNKLVRINKNFVYETNELFNNPIYNNVLKCTRKLSKDINNSFDLVKYWMVFVNKHFGQIVNFTRNGWKILENVYLKKISQEHGIIHLPKNIDKNQFSIGNIIGILPVHSCLTADLMMGQQTLSGLPIEKMIRI